MTVRELIEQLTELDGNLPVVAEDHEDGMYSITSVQVAEPWSIHPKRVVLI